MMGIKTPELLQLKIGTKLKNNNKLKVFSDFSPVTVQRNTRGMTDSRAGGGSWSKKSEVTEC